tara:strand:+ start:1653 stop:1943 length:291 start_codon:yes stop_codon:yes gene_type:complete
MTTITINNQELEFSFKFKQVRQLVNKVGKDIEQFEEIVKDLNNVIPIGAIGTGKTEEEIEELIDADGTFNAVKQILEAFTNEVVIFFSPNSQSQAN